MMWKAIHKVLSKFIPKNVFKKKRTKWILGISLFFIFRIGISLSPTTAIRYELCAMGHPIQAIHANMQFKSAPYKEYSKSDKQLYTFINPPYDNITKSDLCTWEVRRIGIFYFAKYYRYE